MKRSAGIILSILLMITMLMTAMVFADAGETEEDDLFHAHTLVYNAYRNPTGTSDGNIEYWRCSGCGRYFADSKGYKEITDKSSVVIPAGTNVKKVNPLTVKIASKTYKRSSLKKAKSFKIGASGKGNITYTRNEKAKKAKIKVSSKGKVTIPKKCKKGTYKITVRAAGNDTYNAGTKTVTVKVK